MAVASNEPAAGTIASPTNSRRGSAGFSCILIDCRAPPIAPTPVRCYCNVTRRHRLTAVPSTTRGNAMPDTTITLNVNGHERKVTTHPERLLLDVLREEFQLTGTKYGCGEGRCGACTVLIDGKRMYS